MTSPDHLLLVRFQVECWGVPSVVVAWRLQGDGAVFVWMVRGGAESSEELGFGRILGELGVVEVEVLPPGLHPRLTVHVDDRGLSTCHQLLGGSLIYSQTCSVCLHSTLWKT